MYNNHTSVYGRSSAKSPDPSFMGQPQATQAKVEKLPLQNVEALRLMKSVPTWARCKENFVFLHEIRAALLAYPEFSATSAVVLMYAGNLQPMAVYQLMNAPPQMLCLTENQPPPSSKIQPKHWLIEYREMMAQLDKDQLLKKRFDNTKHILFDMHGIGSLIANKNRQQILNMYNAFYTMEDIPDDVLAVLGVDMTLVPKIKKQEDKSENLSAAEQPCEADNSFYMVPASTLSTAHVHQDRQMELKSRVTRPLPPKQYLCACSDESIREAVDASFRGNISFRYTWRPADNKKFPDIYFMRFDNRNTSLNERQDMGPQTLLVVGYFPKKLGETELMELDKELKTLVSNIVWTEIYNDDSKKMSELRLKEPDEIIKRVTQEL